MINIHRTAFAVEIEHELTNHIYRSITSLNAPRHVYIEEAGEAIRECYRFIRDTDFTEISKRDALKLLDASVEKVYAVLNR